MKSHQFNPPIDFWENLMDQIYPQIRKITNINKGHLLFINSFEGWDIEKPYTNSLLYGGINTQIKHLRENPISLSSSWSFLDKTRFSVGESIESKRYIGKRYPSNKDLAAAPYIGDLETYFGKWLSISLPENDQQEYEYNILKQYFSIEEDHFISIPIPWNDMVVTVVQVVFQKEDRSCFENENILEILVETLTYIHTYLVSQFKA